MRKLDLSITIPDCTYSNYIRKTISFPPVDHSKNLMERLFALEARNKVVGIDKHRIIDILKYDIIDDTKHLIVSLKVILGANLYDTPPSDDLINNDPAMALLILLISPDSDYNLREKAAANYKGKYPDDKLFQKNYAFHTTPHVFVAHLLITGGFWTNLNVPNFYQETIVGIYFSYIKFNVGDGLFAENLSIRAYKSSIKIPSSIFDVGFSTYFDPTLCGNKPSSTWFCVKKAFTLHRNFFTARLMNTVYIDSRIGKLEPVLQEVRSLLKNYAKEVQQQSGFFNHAITLLSLPNDFNGSNISENLCSETVSRLISNLSTDPKDTPNDFLYEAMLTIKFMTTSNAFSGICEFNINPKFTEIIDEVTSENQIDNTSKSLVHGRVKNLSRHGHIKYTFREKVGDEYFVILEKQSYGQPKILDIARFIKFTNYSSI